MSRKLLFTVVQKFPVPGFSSKRGLTRLPIRHGSRPCSARKSDKASERLRVSRGALILTLLSCKGRYHSLDRKRVVRPWLWVFAIPREVFIAQADFDRRAFASMNGPGILSQASISIGISRAREDRWPTWRYRTRGLSDLRNAVRPHPGEVERPSYLVTSEQRGSSIHFGVMLETAQRAKQIVVQHKRQQAQLPDLER
jgi:hypothetical protein